MRNLFKKKLGNNFEWVFGVLDFFFFLVVELRVLKSVFFVCFGLVLYGINLML